jgi:16S rRNA (adenine1518-N6/adenine1519-N6)-dimethyltransferase
MIRAKKSLGQNFLTDKNIIEKITNLINIKNKNILEIGPGTGNLTSAILSKNPKRLIVVEKDDNLAQIIKDKFNKGIEVINKDILTLDENYLCEEKLIVFGNLPYNISTEILCRWIINLKKHYWFECLILMFQKEVADRIIAEFNTKNYGRLAFCLDGN